MRSLSFTQIVAAEGVLGWVGKLNIGAPHRKTPLQNSVASLQNSEAPLANFRILALIYINDCTVPM